MFTCSADTTSFGTENPNSPNGPTTAPAPNTAAPNTAAPNPTPTDCPCGVGCSSCSGKASSLTLKVIGELPPGSVTFSRKAKRTKRRSIGGTWDGSGTYTLTDPQDVNLGTAVYLTDGAGTEYFIHTSCSVPIGPGMQIDGMFEVVAGESLNGGTLCAVDCACAGSADDKDDQKDDDSDKSGDDDDSDKSGDDKDSDKSGDDDDSNTSGDSAGSGTTSSNGVEEAEWLISAIGCQALTCDAGDRIHRASAQDFAQHSFVCCAVTC